MRVKKDFPNPVKPVNFPAVNFETELTALINKYGLEKPSNTPDFILAKYLVACLAQHNEIAQARDEWHKSEKTFDLTNIQ